MGTAALTSLPDRRDPLVRRIALEWRKRTRESHAPTLVACSGGADSSALAIALAATRAPITLGHIVHDMRPAPDAEKDAHSVRSLASALGVPVLVDQVETGGGNAEAVARRERYRALTAMATTAGCQFVASAHHADDQLETLLMAVLRGAGPRGMRGVAPTRPLDSGVTLIRPMLGVTRREAEHLCQQAGWTWTEDQTNQDTTKLRAHIRHVLIPALEEIRPGAGHRAVRTASLMRQVPTLIETRAQQVWVEGKVRYGEGSVPVLCSWSRDVLRAETGLVIGEILRRAASDLLGGSGLDRIGHKQLDRVVGSIRSRSGEAKEFHWHATRVEVSKDSVVIRRDEERTS